MYFLERVTNVLPQLALTPSFSFANLFAKTVALGLSFLHLCFSRSPFPVQRQNSLGTGRETAALKAAVEGVGVLPDPS